MILKRILPIICISATTFATTAASADKPLIRVATDNTEMIMTVADNGNLVYNYYGKKFKNANPFQTKKYNEQPDNGAGYAPQAFPAYGGYVMISPALKLIHADGSHTTHLKYVSHKQTNPADGVTLTEITIIQFGDLYRLKNPEDGNGWVSHQYVSKDGKESVFFAYSTKYHGRTTFFQTRLKSDENSERIFETFYQTDKSQEKKNGVGIGLPLSRSLAVLLGGSLYLEKSASKENVFVLSIPLKASPQTTGQLSANDHGSSIVYEEDSNQTPLTANGYHVLLVEDNEGIRSMLNDRLASSFLITLASNGKEALEILATKTVDVIVTDIMMPEMDGFELCKRVKADPDLSHIPVVFITAKNDIDSKVKGLQFGAEAYIEKPFSVKYLREMVVSLLENRRRAREAFAKKPFFQAENIPVNKEDEKFMEKVLAVIKENMGDEEFNVEALGDKMCMSRSNLLRHIKSVFNLSPSELIRVVRLKTAAELIKTGAYTLGEISRMIGISSQSYFTKMFFKQFNVMPNEFAKQVNNPESKT